MCAIIVAEPGPVVDQLFLYHRSAHQPTRGRAKKATALFRCFRCLLLSLHYMSLTYWYAPNMLPIGNPMETKLTHNIGPTVLLSYAQRQLPAFDTTILPPSVLLIKA